MKNLYNLFEKALTSQLLINRVAKKASISSWRCGKVRTQPLLVVSSCHSVDKRERKSSCLNPGCVARKLCEMASVSAAVKVQTE